MLPAIICCLPCLTHQYCLGLCACLALTRPHPLVLPPPQALNQAISDLQTFSGGGPNKQSADHSHTVVDNLRSRLKDATQVRGAGAVGGQTDCMHFWQCSSGCRKQRGCCTVTLECHTPLPPPSAAQEFKDVLTTRTDNLKAHQERKSMFSAAPEGGAARQPLFSQPGAPALVQRRRGAARLGQACSYSCECVCCSWLAAL